MATPPAQLPHIINNVGKGSVAEESRENQPADISTANEENDEDVRTSEGLETDLNYEGPHTRHIVER